MDGIKVFVVFIGPSGSGFLAKAAEVNYRLTLSKENQ